MKMTQAPAATLQAAPSTDAVQTQDAQPSNSSMQEEVAASAPDGEQGGPRLTGTDSAALREALGEPKWAVDSKNSWDFFQDTMKVVGHEWSLGVQRPGWYKGEGSPRNLGELQRTNGPWLGGWRQLGVKDGAGLYEVGYIDNVTGENQFWLVEYTPARARVGPAAHLQNDDGSGSTASKAFGAHQILFDFISALSPGNNFLKAAMGREMDPFDPEFGAALTKWERFLETVKGAAKMTPLAAESMTEPEVQGWVIGIAAELGESVIDQSVEHGLIDQADTHYIRAWLQLWGTAGQIAKWDDGDARAMSDYLGSISAIWGASEEYLRGYLGDECYDEFWVPYTGLIGEVVGDADKFATVYETLKGSGH